MDDRELYTEVNGQKEDAGLHDDLLDNREAEEATAVEAVQRAMRDDGLSQDQALAFYGTPNTAERLKH